MTLWCRACETMNTFDRNWIADDDACSDCKTKGQWRTLNEPKVPYTLTEKDKRFLTALRVEST